MVFVIIVFVSGNVVLIKIVIKEIKKIWCMIGDDWLIVFYDVLIIMINIYNINSYLLLILKI